jgi:hypothetical protein
MLANQYEVKDPGLHTYQQPPSHRYINSQMYKGLNDTTVSVTVIEDVMLFPLHNAVTLYQGEGRYVILMNIRMEGQASDWTLLHEWGHVYQMHDSSLVRVNRTEWYWHGEEVDWSLDWHERPWEIQADSIAVVNLRRLYPLREPKPTTDYSKRLTKPSRPFWISPDDPH